jgi:hypothetical protein
LDEFHVFGGGFERHLLSLLDDDAAGQQTYGLFR